MTNKHRINLAYDSSIDYMDEAIKLADTLKADGKQQVIIHDDGNGATVEYSEPILNLTQHVGTPAQVADGLIEPTADDKSALKQLLTFEELPEQMRAIVQRVDGIIRIADKYSVKYVMIGGAGYLMHTLVDGLKFHGYRPLHSFTRRVVVEHDNGDGTIAKQSIFEHVGWVKDFVVD